MLLGDDTSVRQVQVVLKQLGKDIESQISWAQFIQLIHTLRHGTGSPIVSPTRKLMVQKDGNQQLFYVIVHL